MLFSLTVVLGVLSLVASSAEFGSLNEDNALKFFEGLVGSMSKDPSYRLPKEWRDENGNLKKANLRDISAGLKAVNSQDSTVKTQVKECVGITPKAATYTDPTTKVDYTVNYEYSISTSPCIWMQGNLAAVNMNFNTATSSATLTPIAFAGTATGFACNNCYAYVGAKIGFSMNCALLATTPSCSIGFSTGGGIGYNVNLAMTNPTLTGSSTVNVASTTTAITLFQDPSTGLYIEVAGYSLDITVTGDLTAKGSTTAASGFSTQANFNLGMTTAGAYVQGFDAAVVVNPPTVSASGLTLSANADINYQVVPTITWNIGDAFTSSLTGTNAVYATFKTPFTAEYMFTEAATNTACTSGQALSVNCVLTGVTTKVASVPYTVSVTASSGPAALYTSAAGTSCLTASSASSSGSSSTDPACFAGSETVSMQSGESKLISEIKVGDVVLASDMQGNTKYSEVIAVPHGVNQITAHFSQIATAERDIKLTPDHLILSGACGSASMSLVQAGDVEIGACIMTVNGQQEVTSNIIVQSVGIYTIVTKDSEFVVVNGIIASPFAVNHLASNAFYNIHRTLYAVSPMLVGSGLVKAATEAFGSIVASV